jgi:hypothetical protein
LYDVLPTVLYVRGDNLGLRLGGNKELESVTAAPFDRLARRTEYGVEAARKRVTDAVDRIMTNWPVMRSHLTRESFGRLTDRHGSLALLGGR